MRVLESVGSRYTGLPFAVSYIVAGVLAAHLVSFFLPGVWALPLVNAGIFYFLFQAPLRGGDYSGAVRLALIWAAVTSLLQIGLILGMPGLMEGRIWRAVEYRDQMFSWVRTGAGPEGDIRLFLPIHLKHFVVFSVVSLVTGGFLGLAMGAAMLGYMNFYVGCLLAETSSLLLTGCLAWPVWSVVRVVGYIVAGAALGAVIMHRNEQKGEKYSRLGKMYLLSLLLIALDIVLKWSLAGTWQKLLSSALAAGVL
jgi:hypothetical protein